MRGGRICAYKTGEVTFAGTTNKAGNSPSDGSANRVTDMGRGVESIANWHWFGVEKPGRRDMENLNKTSIRAGSRNVYGLFFTLQQHLSFGILVLTFFLLFSSLRKEPFLFFPLYLPP